MGQECTAATGEPEQVRPSHDNPSLLDAHFLQNHLCAEFQRADTPTGTEVDADMSESLSPFARASMRQAKAIQELADHLQTAGELAESNLSGDIRTLCDTLIDAEAEAQKKHDDVEHRFESLTGVMSLLACHLARQRSDIQRNSTFLRDLSDKVKQINDATAIAQSESAGLHQLFQSSQEEVRQSLTTLREDIYSLRTMHKETAARIVPLEMHLASHTEVKSKVLGLERSVAELYHANYGESAQLRDLIQSSQDRLQNGMISLENNISSLSGELSETAERVAPLERQAATYDLLAREMHSNNDNLTAMRHASQRAEAGLRAVEQKLEALSQREKILADIHQRAARALTES